MTGHHSASLSHSQSVHVSRFFSPATAPTEIYTLSLHDALPILPPAMAPTMRALSVIRTTSLGFTRASWTLTSPDRKSTRLNSSHRTISYAVFCLKKKNNYRTTDYYPTLARNADHPQAKTYLQTS